MAMSNSFLYVYQGVPARQVIISVVFFGGILDPLDPLTHCKLFNWTELGSVNPVF